LTSTLNRGEWSASRPGRFTHTERAPVSHWIGGWVGPRAVLDAVHFNYESRITRVPKSVSLRAAYPEYKRSRRVNFIWWTLT